MSTVFRKWMTTPGTARRLHAVAIQQALNDASTLFAADPLEMALTCIRRKNPVFVQKRYL